MSLPAFDASEHAHRRWNPLTETWVTVSPHRTKRPWQGQTEPPNVEERPTHDPKCYLCPGNERAGGQQTPTYDSTYIFQNDFAAVTTLETLSPSAEGADSSLFRAEPARGNCFVICFNPNHAITLAEMKASEIVPVIEAWQKLYLDVSKEPWARYIQMRVLPLSSPLREKVLRSRSFENKGAMMGCSNPHPHGQAWCLSYVPSIAVTIFESQQRYAASTSAPLDSSRSRLSNGKASLLLDYAFAESDSERLVHSSNHFLAVVPYWATWPFEVMILPRLRHVAHTASLTDEEKQDLAETIRAVACRCALRPALS